MKKKFIFILTILLFTCACSGSSLKKINLNNLKDMLNKKETFILYLTDESTEGNVLKKSLTKVSKNNKLITYYLNTKNLNEKEIKELKNIITFEDTNIIIFIKKGSEETVLSRIDDVYLSESKLKDEFKIQGYIK